ncbi:endogenous retrovirus group K member 6 Env polyprotein-like [Sorex fumeus]|uniref:endogenous retrovirus group K member 6 Env polyprotein-like n=1 Tax=Sorex fumeus TaxID=62283 RepID=UPI0024ACD3BF|nr:endogenous retrovirus group K member 6 Env polyprotein-like [Sorex fumeus]
MPTNLTSLGQPSIPLCEFISMKDWQYSPREWTECRSPLGKLSHRDDYELIDWGPRGKFVPDCVDDLDYTRCHFLPAAKWCITSLFSSPPSCHIQTQEPLEWHDGGYAPPRPRAMRNGTLYPEHTDLWKVAAALSPGHYWDGYLDGSKQLNFTYYISYNSSFHVQACVKHPYVFARGTLSFDPVNKKVSCRDCALFTCLNSSLSVQDSPQSIILLKARSHIWLPVNLTREWQCSPAEGLLTEVMTRLLRRSRRFLGLLIVAILGLIAVTTTAAVAGTALQTSIQTHDFVKTWQNDSHHLWKMQATVNHDVEQRLDTLQQMLLWVQGRVDILEQQMRLFCDWNSSSFCVTPHRYNGSAHAWEKIRYHLQDLKGNMSLDTLALQNEIVQVFKEKLPGVQYENLAQGIADALQGLDPKSWWQSITHAIGSAGGEFALWKGGRKYLGGHWGKEQGSSRQLSACLESANSGHVLTPPTPTPRVAGPTYPSRVQW